MIKKHKKDTMSVSIGEITTIFNQNLAENISNSKKITNFGII